MSTSDSVPIFDRDVALSRAGDDEELMAELAAITLQHCPIWLKELAEAVANSNQEDTLRLAHTLKNSADNMGGHQARDAAFEMEQAVRRQSEDISRLFARVQETYHPFLAALQTEFAK